MQTFMYEAMKCVVLEACVVFVLCVCADCCVLVCVSTDQTNVGCFVSAEAEMSSIDRR